MRCARIDEGNFALTEQAWTQFLAALLDQVPSLGQMRLTVELPVRADRSEVWAAVSTVDGINQEVAPFLRMTDPTRGAPRLVARTHPARPSSWLHRPR
jgi:hypothetical protein